MFELIYIVLDYLKIGSKNLSILLLNILYTILNKYCLRINFGLIYFMSKFQFQHKFIITFIIGYFLLFSNGLSEQTLNFINLEKMDTILLKDQISLLNLYSNDSSFNEMHNYLNGIEVSNIKRDFKSFDPRIKKKNEDGSWRNSIFVYGLSTVQMFPNRRELNCYDSSKNRFIKESIMLNAHLECRREFMSNLPREITKSDKKVKFKKITITKSF